MVDLHMHTKNSDGTDTTEEILKKCEELKLDIISITDHDTCRSYDDMKNIDVKSIFKGEIIPGCELTTSYKGRVIEILGYDVNPDVINAWKNKYYTPQKKLAKRRYMANQLVPILSKKGLEINKSEIDFTQASCDREIYNLLAKQQEKVESILGTHLMESVKNFFRDGVANPESYLYVDTTMYYPSVEEVLKIIDKAGGKSFLAHPYQYAFEDTFAFLEEFTNEYKIDGVESFHSSFTIDEMKKLYNWAKEKELLVSGGSDYHGTKKPEISLKTGCNNLFLLEDVVTKWYKKS